MTIPYVGNPSTTAGVCTYADKHGDPECGKPATVHALTLIENADGTAATLPACNDHAALAIGMSTAFHTFGPTCAGDVMWLDGGCRARCENCDGDRCCREHGRHSMPHRGCILR